MVKLSDRVYYVGVNDTDKVLFEGLWPLPVGVSYNSYVVADEKVALIDKVSTRFGCRTFRIDPENGFILNGEEYPLRGVSRHQDRWGIGNALLPEHHEEDIGYIMELGATTIRLAHDQHDQ